MAITEIKRVTLLESDLEKKLLSGPLSRETSFTLYLTGPVRAEHIERIIQLLQMQKQWLEPPPGGELRPIPGMTVSAPAPNSAPPASFGNLITTGKI